MNCGLQVYNEQNKLAQWAQTVAQCRDCVRRSAKSPRPAKLGSGSAEIEQWDRPD